MAREPGCWNQAGPAPTQVRTTMKRKKQAHPLPAGNEMSLKEFMEKVDARVTAMPADVVRTFVKQHARGLPVAERAAFLSSLDSVTLPASDPAPDGKVDTFLLDEIQGLTKIIASGKLCKGYGWDPEIKDMRDFGDESWSEEVDGFFDRARDSLLDGHFDLAWEAYETIFSILDMGEEDGHLPGPPNCEELLETDMDEARALYLRAAYLASKGSERPEAILDVLFRFPYDVGERLNMTAMRNAGEGIYPRSRSSCRIGRLTLACRRRKQGDLMIGSERGSSSSTRPNCWPNTFHDHVQHELPWNETTSEERVLK
jgi:hypothetical protein